MTFLVDHWAFCIFFFIGFVAIFFKKYRVFKLLFLITFFSIMFYFGLGGGMNWPFMSWHLYAIKIDRAIEYHEIRLVDSIGNEIKYDARAVPPIITTPLRRLATNMPSFTNEEVEELGSFLFNNANRYRDKIQGEGPILSSYIKFPLHQYGFRWNEGNLGGMGVFRKLRVYKVNIILDERGRTVDSREDQCMIDLKCSSDVCKLLQSGS